MKIKNRVLFNLIFIVTLIFSSTTSATDTQELPMKNIYHEIDIVDANKDSFGIKIKNVNDKNIEDIRLESVKLNDDKLEIHSHKINDLKVEEEVELNGKYLSSIDKNKEEEINNFLENRKNEIIKTNTSKSINWTLVISLIILSLLALVSAILLKKLPKFVRGIISLAALALIAFSIYLTIPTKKYYTKLDKVKFTYTDKEGKVNSFYGLLNYKIEEYAKGHERYDSNRIEYFDNTTKIKEEVENRSEELDFNTVEKTSDEIDVVIKDEDGNYKLNKQVTEGQKGKKTFEEVYLKIQKDDRLVSREKKSEKVIKEVKPKDKIIVTGTKPVRLKENLDYSKVYKSDITAEVGSSKVDERVKAKQGQKVVVYTYNTETKELERSENINKPTNEVVLVGVVKYVTEDIDFEEEIVKRDDLPETHKKVIQEGKPGKITKKYELAINEETGKVIEDINKAKLIESDKEKPVNQITEIGTKIENKITEIDTKPVIELNEFGLTKEEENYLDNYEDRFTSNTRLLLNNLRSRNKLNELRQNDILDKVAENRNLDNINNNKFSHEYSMDGVLYSAKQEANNLGYAYPNTVGENIAVTEFHVKDLNQIEDIIGNPEFYAEEIINNYYEDPGQENLSKGHRKSMLSPIWSDAGFDLEIRAVKQSDGSYKVKIHGAQIFGVGRVLETQEDVDMFNYFRSTYQTDTNYFVPTRGLDSYESYLKRDSILQYFNDYASAKAFREKSIAENNAFNKAISTGEANLENLSNYENHKNFFENMKSMDKQYR